MEQLMHMQISSHVKNAKAGKAYRDAMADGVDANKATKEMRVGNDWVPFSPKFLDLPVVHPFFCALVRRLPEPMED
jgi:hypothetical protein